MYGYIVLQTIVLNRLVIYNYSIPPLPHKVYIFMRYVRNEPFANEEVQYEAKYGN